MQRWRGSTKLHIWLKRKTTTPKCCRAIRNCRCVLWTHDVGGLTDKDFKLARSIDDITSSPATPLMKYLKKLDGFQRSPAGLEWRIWKKLHVILAVGTAPATAGQCRRVSAGWA